MNWPTDWVIAFWEDERDFLLESSATLPSLDLQNDKRFQYNQGSTKDCTLYSAFGALSDLMDYELTKEDIKEIVDKSYEMWRWEWEWRYVQSWVKCVCQRWNKKHPENPVAYYRIDLDDKDLVNDIISKNYTLCTWYKGNYNYNYDYVVDDKLDWDSFGKATYWHAVSVIMNDWKRSIKDNYYPRLNSKKQDTNIYEIIPEFNKLIKNWVYYANAYLIVKVNNEERIAELKRLNEFKVDVEEAIELNSKMWRETNSEEFKNFLHETNEKLRAKLKDISVEMNKFSL
jgi:hypothetical protein